MTRPYIIHELFIVTPFLSPVLLLVPEFPYVFGPTFRIEVVSDGNRGIRSMDPKDPDSKEETFYSY